MKSLAIAQSLAVLATLLATAALPAFAQPADPRLREVAYDPKAVITVPVKRGMVTHVVLDPAETITEIGAGLGGDCAKPESVWCVAAPPGGHHIFVKPKSGANAPNNLAVVTDRRLYSLRFVVLADNDARSPVFRLLIKPPAVKQAAALPTVVALPPLPPLIEPGPLPEQVVAERIDAAPHVVNTRYAIAEGAASADIVPTLIFDDGRFTYLRFPGNQEVPAVFHVLGDGSESVVNARMEGDLLVVDRVSRRLMLRAGSAVVGVWNEAFDLTGRPPEDGTTVPGVQRVLKAEAVTPAPTAGASQ